MGDAAGQADLAADAGPVQSFFGQTMLLYLPLLFTCPLLTTSSGLILPILSSLNSNH